MRRGVLKWQVFWSFETAGLERLGGGIGQPGTAVPGDLK
jgi:hypothetical protein